MNKIVKILAAFTLFCVCSLCVPSFGCLAEENSSEIVMEVNSRRVLYGKNIDEQKPMASTTKILTAIIIIEDCDLSETVKIPREAVGIEGSSVYLKEGEEYTVEDLLYGLMLRSGNDCSVALAVNHSGTVQDFVKEMNKRAYEIGALNSRFENPNGLPSDGHYTTAYDLALISCYAMGNETFRKIVSSTFYQKYNWQNKNKMLYNYDGADGIKTGYTIKAGRCLVTSAVRNGMRIVCVVLNCHEMYEETTMLLNDAFGNFSYECIFDNRGKIYQIPTCFKDKIISAEADNSVYYPIRKEESDYIRIEENVPERLDLPVKKGDIIGNIKIYFANQLLFSENLCSIKDVDKSYLNIITEISRDFYL